jgi:hypothetical protein
VRDGSWIEIVTELFVAEEVDGGGEDVVGIVNVRVIAGVAMSIY